MPQLRGNEPILGLNNLQGVGASSSWFLENRGLVYPLVGAQNKRDWCLLQIITCK
jgi:hypothetical protein